MKIYKKLERKKKIQNAKILTHIDLQMNYANELAPAEVVWTIKNNQNKTKVNDK